MPALTPASAIEAASPYLRLLVLGSPKVGKTRTCVGTCPKPAFVIKTDPGDALRPALELSKDFSYVNVESMQDMESAIVMAPKAATDKTAPIKTVVLDTITAFSEMVLEECFDANPDGRAAYGDYAKKLSNVVRRLVNLPCHLIITSHYMDFGNDDGGGKGVAKKWTPGKEGIVPLINGKARKIIPSLVDDIVFLEKMPDGKREFVTSIDGIAGPGCRSLKSLAGVTTCEADIGKLMELFEKR